MITSAKCIILVLQVIEVLSFPVEEQKFPTNCGSTPMHPTEQIVNGYIISPDEYSWVASLQYGNGSTFGHCGGSVINSRYVLTAAHCVEGEIVNKHGGLTGVRLGDFTHEPYCDYGAPDCTSYHYFKITDIIKHKEYRKDENKTLHNDIALLRLDSRIQFNNKMQPVCLPNVHAKEPDCNTTLTVVGWGSTSVDRDRIAKRGVGIKVLTNSTICEYPDDGRLCAAVLPSKNNVPRTTCDGDSGGPLMQEWQKRTMVIEGIVSFLQGGSCLSNFFPTHYTRVRHYMNWLEEHMCMGDDCPTSTSIAERKFPTDCGVMSTLNGQTVPHQEYSWLATLMYEKEGYQFCVGSVINSRYVLTAASCVDRGWINKSGDITGVRLRDYDENGLKCDFVSESCTQYQQFGIEKIIPHPHYDGTESGRNVVNDIALIRLDSDIQFGTKMQPICLPFGSNVIREEPLGNLFTVNGLHRTRIPLTKCSDTPTSKYLGDRCNKQLYENGVRLCSFNSCCRDFGSPLMHQFAARRMVLEGIDTFGFMQCSIFAVKFTRVRDYGDWLNDNMDM